MLLKDLLEVCKYIDFINIIDLNGETVAEIECGNWELAAGTREEIENCSVLNQMPSLLPMCIGQLDIMIDYDDSEADENGGENHGL